MVIEKKELGAQVPTDNCSTVMESPKEPKVLWVLNPSSGRHRASRTSATAKRGGRVRVTTAEHAQTFTEKPRSPARRAPCHPRDATEGARPPPSAFEHLKQGAEREAGCSSRRPAQAPGRQPEGARMEGTTAAGAAGTASALLLPHPPLQSLQLADI